MPPVLLDLVIARVRAYAKAKGWAPSRFAIEAGLSPDALRALHRDDWNPRADTLEKLEALIPDDFVVPPSSASTSEAA